MPAAGKIAVGPLKLSIQPGNGSRQVAPTIEGLSIAHGNLSLHSCITNVSAIAFVYVYVLGRSRITFGVS